jgi:hypothetical protein
LDQVDLFTGSLPGISVTAAAGIFLQARKSRAKEAPNWQCSAPHALRHDDTAWAKQPKPVF